MLPAPQTRRSTRRSLGNGQGVENDVANRVLAPAPRAGTGLASGAAAIKPAAAAKPAAAGTALRQRPPLGTGKSVLADKVRPLLLTTCARARDAIVWSHIASVDSRLTTILLQSAASIAAAAARGKRQAFTDVTNGGKAKAGPSAAAGKVAPRPATASTASNAVASSSNIPTRPKYRTRSSTGGAIKEEPIEEAFAEAAGEGIKHEPHSDAMAIDDEATTSRATGRQVKSLRKGAAGVSKVGASTSAAPVRRPLAAKRDSVNGVVTHDTLAAGARQSKATPEAVQIARRRVEQAEARHRAALEELEAAKRLEADELKRAALDDLDQEAGRRVKRQKTSEPEPFLLKDELDEEDEEAENELEGPRMSKWETEVEGRAKDEGWEDLDEGDEEDPLMVSTYVVEVYEYLRELEVRRLSCLASFVRRSI